jgi:hypothetical protein
MSDEGRVMPTEAAQEAVPANDNTFCRAKRLSVSSGRQSGTTAGRRAGNEWNHIGCRAGDITILSRGVCRRVLKLQTLWEGSSGKVATAANRTREIRPSGMRGGLAETWISRQ